MLVYALALVGLFTVSALYHGITWPRKAGVGCVVSTMR
jgi:hypothetical protein